MKKDKLKKGEIIIYKTSSGPKLGVRLEGDTIWLTQIQISLLFDTERSVITKHLNNNVFKDGEIQEKSNVQKMHIPNSDKPVSFYSLDAVISVGYRVNSKRATQFRIWANKNPAFWQDFWCGPGGICTRFAACQWQHVTTYTTGPDPRWQDKTKRAPFQGLLLLTSGFSP